MQLIEKILTFDSLGSHLKSQQALDEIEELCYRIENENKWFTRENVKEAINSIVDEFLNKEKLSAWLKGYSVTNTPKKVGIICAGNIPAVSFFDILSVLILGHEAHLKLSSTDSILVKFLINKLISIEPKFENQIKFVERMNDVDALIATGSDSTAKHFEYYFASKPRIIRQNRTSIAVLDGNESNTDFRNLAEDIFKYFGLGCRNISKVLVPKGYDFTPFYDTIQYWDTIMVMNKYANNYDYNKSVLLVNGTPHLDNGFLLVREAAELVSPISVLFYQYYETIDEVQAYIQENKSKIQCIVSNNQSDLKAVGFGQSQKPTLTDYPDDVNVLEFLTSL